MKASLFNAFILYLARSLTGLSVLFYALVSLAAEVWPASVQGYPSSSWILLFVLLFGIIGVRFEIKEAAVAHHRGRYVWPYVLGGVAVIAAVIYWATLSWAPVWRITMGMYASAMLATIMLVMFEE